MQFDINHAKRTRNETQNEQNRPLRTADSARAELARRGGEQLVEELTSWLSGYEELLGEVRLSSAYGRVVGISQYLGHWDMLFVPADGTRSLRLVVPRREDWTQELLAEAHKAQCSSADRVLVIEVLSSASEFAGGDYDAALFGVCTAPSAEVVMGPHLVTFRENDDSGTEIVAPFVDTDRVIDPAVVVYRGEAF
jgi:hypothetical protein